ncbi:MAG: DUF4411 family protein [Christensenella sp.]|uniref:DUF4411 family protein n=1 Tax=Christensenella sp. TaxID=1935934 RepID=UPI002B1FC8A1|nr:DUF4411 family protein [Christensenella sp.]MEA5004131.1 DUF4411 family protein [Christensenella sp.]
MTYVLDSNTLITSYKYYYSQEIAPHFWEHISEWITKGTIIVIDVVKNEICRFEEDDFLKQWVIDECSEYIFNTGEDGAVIKQWSDILNFINVSSFYSDKAYRAWADDSIADPWLIAFCAVQNATCVTFEQPSTSQNKPKIPNFCSSFNVRCINLFEMMRELGITLIK